MSRYRAAISGAACLAAACSNETAAPAAIGSVTGLAATTVAAQTVAGTAYFSSTKLNVTWTAPATGTAPTRYSVYWTDQVANKKDSTTVAATNVSLTDLKSKTSYKIDVKACTATACETGMPATVTQQTPIEVWQLQGSGNTVSGLTKIVSDGNVRLHVMRYGNDAGVLAGKLQLYYGPTGGTPQKLTVGTATAAAVQATTSTYLSFTSQVGVAGLISPTSAATLVQQVATGQGVPLSATMGGKVRLFFEANGADGKTRIMYVDSKDAYTGLDFNSGSASTCSTQADYTTPSGGCAPTVAIGVEGDATSGNPKIGNARQFKIGFSTQSDWRWDGAAGTFMLFTTDAITGCSTSPMNHGYAVWSGSAWTVQYVAAGGCPKLFTSAQAMHPVHLGGVKYKAYYGDPSDQTGKLSSGLPFLGPKKLMYADGAASGSATTVDFEDWEGTSAGRTLTFLWPDGTTLNSTAMGYIDDFSIVAPAANLAWQMFYVAITDGTAAPILAAAILINP